MKRKICVVTGTRAEYRLLKHIMKEIDIHPSLELYTIVTGSHLSKKYGCTIKEIEKDNFKIDDKVDMNITGKDKKDMANAMKIYKSELKEYLHPRSLKGIEIHARKRGMEAHIDMAESFILIREICE